MLSPLAKGLGTWDGQVVIDAKEAQQTPDNNASSPFLPSLLVSSGSAGSEREGAFYGNSDKATTQASLPRTFATRKGALLLFTGPEDLLIDYRRPKFPISYVKHNMELPHVKTKDVRKVIQTTNMLRSTILDFGNDFKEKKFEPSSKLHDGTYSTLNKRRNFVRFLSSSDWDAIDKFNFPGTDSNYYLKGIQNRLSRQDKKPLTKIRRTADEIIKEYASEDVLTFNFSKYEGSFKQDEVPTDVINNNNASKEVDEVASVNNANPYISEFHVDKYFSDTSHDTSTKTIWQSEGYFAEMDEERATLKSSPEMEQDWILEDEISNDDLYSVSNLMLIQGSQRVWSPSEAILTHKTSHFPPNTNNRVITETKITNLDRNHFKKLQPNAVRSQIKSTYDRNIHKHKNLNELVKAKGKEIDHVLTASNHRETGIKSNLSRDSDVVNEVWMDADTDTDTKTIFKQLDHESVTNRMQNLNPSLNSKELTNSLSQNAAMSKSIPSHDYDQLSNLSKEVQNQSNITFHDVTTNKTDALLTSNTPRPPDHLQINEKEIDKKLAKLAGIGRLRASSTTNDFLLDGKETLMEAENYEDKIFSEVPRKDAEFEDRKIKFIPLRNVRGRSKISYNSSENKVAIKKTSDFYSANTKTENDYVDKDGNNVLFGEESPDNADNAFNSINSNIQLLKEDSKSDDNLDELKSIAKDLLERNDTLKLQPTKLKTKMKKRRKKKTFQDENERKQSWVKITEPMESTYSSEVLQNALKASPAAARNSMINKDLSISQGKVNQKTETIPIEVSVNFEVDTEEPITAEETALELIAVIESDNDDNWKTQTLKKYGNKKEEKKLAKEYEKMLKEREKQKQKLRKEIERKRGNVGEKKLENKEPPQKEGKDVKQDTDTDFKRMAKKQREAKRLADAERRRLEVQRKRTERKEIEARQAEAEKRAMEEREKNEQILKEKLVEEQRLKDMQRRLQEEKDRMEARIKEKQLEQERESELLKQRLAEEEVQRLLKMRLQQQQEEELRRKEEENRKLLEEQQRAKDIEERKQRELEDKIKQAQAARKRENEIKDQAKRRLKRLAEERQKAADLEKHRALMLAKQEQNMILFNELKKIMYGQGLTRAWLFSYFVHVPRHIWELPMGYSKDKKNRIMVKIKQRRT